MGRGDRVGAGLGELHGGVGSGWPSRWCVRRCTSVGVSESSCSVAGIAVGAAVVPASWLIGQAWVRRKADWGTGEPFSAASAELSLDSGVARRAAGLALETGRCGRRGPRSPFDEAA